MKTLYFLFFFALCIRDTTGQTNEMKLWYKKPAANWHEALPVGNGRIGAMVFGNPQHDTIQINEESLWAGRPYNDNNPSSLSSLARIQELLLENKNEEAYQLATKNMVAVPKTVRSYQTFMDLTIDYADGTVKDYRRELNLITGIAKTTFTLNGVKITQRVFASISADLLVIVIQSQTPGTLECSFQLSRTQDATVSVKNNVILLNGQINDRENDRQGPGGMNMKFAGAATVKNVGGKLSAIGNTIHVAGASEVILYINARTTYDPDKLNFNNSRDVQKICLQAFQKPLAINDILKNHQTVHSSKMQRVSFHVDAIDYSNVPTDERLAAVKKGTIDQGLIELYFQYGRYLLLGSSQKPGELPANLQGIWCKDFDAPWQSDLHTNINLQMNYWLADVTAIPETMQPLIHFMERIRKNGEVTASSMYGAKGWTMHHTTSAFGQTALHDAIEYGTYPLAGAWMCLHLWEHYQFTQNKKFLSETAYPLMKGSADFISDFLITDKSGFLVTAPSYSPENSFIHPKTGKSTQITYASTMDIQIITELFKAVIAASKVLDTDKHMADRLQETLAKLPPVRINNYGGIQEWIEDYQEAEPGHRHISHLFGLHPGTQINEQTPALFEAAKKTLAHRLANGGGHTGWSRAWIINFYARLKEGDKALEHIHALLAKSTLKNLFDDHPPFQIDGNFGGTAGIAEMLLQSHLKFVELLPALPAAWKNGEVKGLRARGGFSVDMKWREGHLESATFTSLAGKPLEIFYKGRTEKVQLKTGEKFLFQIKNEK
ncbi:MAG TPA: glycoside hydrolase family 95 protein [Flavitalea sp.]|nr:glycoside hydrolase family 95 protein [Flavitalea sp.]